MKSLGFRQNIKTVAINGLWVVALVLSACASRPELTKYPRTQIERPYTLPQGVSTWKTITPFGFFSDRTGDAFLPPIPVPLFWQQSLSDNWTLNWTPLPLSVSHQLHYSKDSVWGVTFGSGLGWANSYGFVLAPSLTLYQRQRLGEKVAWETEPDLSAQYHTKGSPWDWSLGLSTGPRFQLTDTLSLSPKVGIAVERGYHNTLSLADVSITPEITTQTTFPLSLHGSWSFHRQWDLNAGYTFYRLGYSNDYSAHVGVLSLIHYW